MGATILSILIFLFPSLFGEGYGTISTLLDVNEDSSSVMEGSFFYGGNLLLYLTLMVFAKVFASTATNAGGGCGGIFAPSLFWAV